MTHHLHLPSGYWYVATPYSKYPAGIEEAFKAACEGVGRLIKRGVPAFSPIAHSHSVAIYAGIDPLSHDIWLEADRPMMEAAHGLIVLMLPGWNESFGVAHEIEHFEKAGKPVIYLVPYAE